MSAFPQSQAEAHPHVAELPAFDVIGLTTRTSNEAQFAGDDKIGPLWGAFMGGAGQSIPRAVDETIFSLYTHYESDHHGAYDVILGKSVQPGTQAPAGMIAKHIPAATYLVFPAESRAPEAIVAAWQSVYCYFDEPGAPKRAFTIDFERYSDEGVELFIAIPVADAS
jgi:predicted transcriptional regulator YdeE